VKYEHEVKKEQSHFAWDNSLKPVLSVKPEQVVRFEVTDASGGQLSPESTSEDVSKLDMAKVNPVTGPVYIDGAEPGDTLEIKIERFSEPKWGWSAIIPGFGLLADQFEKPYLEHWHLDGKDRAEFRPGINIPLLPMVGTAGVAPKEPGSFALVPPSYHGGNMDYRHLIEGTSLLLPVSVEGALFSIGDTHAAQGHGEVCGTGIEASMDVFVRFKLHKGLSIQEPRYILPPLSSSPYEEGCYVTSGYGEDLYGAAKKAVNYMIEYLQDKYKLSEQEAYILCSVAVNLKIIQIVDAPNYAVAAYLPFSIFNTAAFS